MSNQVLSTEQAATTISQMQTLLNGDLTTNLKTLISQGNTLSEPSVWDGQLAVQFRGSWPTTSQQLNTALTDLQNLAVWLQNVHNAIFQAGGNS